MSCKANILPMTWEVVDKYETSEHVWWDLSTIETLPLTLYNDKSVEPF